MTRPLPPEIWPAGSAVDGSGRLRLGGLDAVALARRYGTPLYVYDAATLRADLRAYRAAFAPYAPARVSYAVKACPLLAVGMVIARGGADASAASLGELLAARRAGFVPARIQLHGNAKTDDDLRGALRARVGRVVIDGADEIERLARLVRRSTRSQPVWLRVSPGITADAHPSLRTGALDSKFGAPLATGEALAQAHAIAATRGLRLVGIHAHLGSMLHDASGYAALGTALAAFACEVEEATRSGIREIGVGGGLGTPLRDGDHALDLRSYAEAVARPIRDDARLRAATIYVEPGRSLVGRAGVVLYSVVGTKRVAGVRTFVAVDGGMGDNIRPALYGAQYSALVADRATSDGGEQLTVVGKYCESGDVLIPEVRLPSPRTGETIAVPGAGAYALAMASNYNSYPRPAVVLIDAGRARLVRARERHADLWRLERR